MLDFFFLIFFLQPEIATEPASPLVPFLQKFADSRNKKPSVSVKKCMLSVYALENDDMDN